MKKHKLAACLSTLVVLSSCALSYGQTFSTKNLTVFSDGDWNFRLYDNCNIRKKAGLKNRVEQVSETGETFLRFTLGNKVMGNCSSDIKPRNNAPFWQRSELKQTSSLKKDTNFELNFDVRFVEGFKGKREVFWQLHSWDKSCKSKPPMRFMFDDGKLSMQPLLNGGYKAPAHSSVSIDSLIGSWHTFKIKFGTAQKSNLSLYIDGSLAIETPFEIEECGVPHLKFGIYRAGDNAGRPTSVVDFDNLQLTLIE